MTEWGAALTTEAATSAELVRAAVRLQMKPNTATRGHVNGAWWPRSHDPVAEFPGLVLVMSSWVGPIRRVTYHLHDWATAGRELTVEGWMVTLVGLPTLDANTIVVTGQRLMKLLVVPPGTPGGAARAVLRSAAAPDTVDSVEEILASNGVRATRQGHRA
jgi:hypothetical protein